MKQAGIGSALVILTLALQSVACASPPVFPHAELSLGGVHIDQSEQQVRERLGEPQSITTQLDFIDRILHYPNLIVSFSEGRIGSIYSDSLGACTPAGLCVGDTLDRAEAIYGDPGLIERAKGSIYWIYRTPFPCFLQITPEGAKVGSLEVACAP